MKTVLIILITFLLLCPTILGGIQGGKGNPFDPPPDIPPYHPPNGPNGPPSGPPNAPPPNPPSVGAIYIQRELIGYGVGELTHPKSLAFCNNLAREIKTLTDSGRRIELIIVRGYADGIRNNGLKYNLGLLPIKCQELVTPGLVDDPKLAFLRGCIIWNLLSGMIDSTQAGGIAWEKQQYDEPTGGLKGDLYRKVTVEVTLRMEE